MQVHSRVEFACLAADTLPPHNGNILNLFNCYKIRKHRHILNPSSLNSDREVDSISQSLNLFQTWKAQCVTLFEADRLLIGLHVQQVSL